jgi:type IV secretion system protein VirB10
MTEPPHAPVKQDPDTLVLRANPKPVVRFKRPVLIGAAAVGCVAIFGITWFGLTPPAPKAAETKELFNADAAADRAKPSADQLAALPSTYADVPAGVPRLGPPLPGDLGGPVLDQQRSGTTYPSSSLPAARSEAPLAPSGVFFQVTAAVSPRAAEVHARGTESPFDVPIVPEAVPAAMALPETPVGMDRQTGSIYNSHGVETPASPYQVMAGTVISANLITGLKSDLSGLVIAQVSAPVFDSVTGNLLLIPQGTRLLGAYENDLGFGQSRVLLIWKRLIMPDGSSLEIDNFPAADRQGYAGLADRVDYHTGSLLKGVGLSTLLGLTTYDGRDDDSDLVRAFRDSTRTTGNQAGQELVRRSMDIKPTVTIRAGYPVRVIVQKDLILRPYEGRTTPWQN